MNDLLSESDLFLCLFQSRLPLIPIFSDITSDCMYCPKRFFDLKMNKPNAIRQLISSSSIVAAPAPAGAEVRVCRESVNSSCCCRPRPRSTPTLALEKALYGPLLSGAPAHAGAAVVEPQRPRLCRAPARRFGVCVLSERLCLSSAAAASIRRCHWEDDGGNPTPWASSGATNWAQLLAEPKTPSREHSPHQGWAASTRLDRPAGPRGAAGAAYGNRGIGIVVGFNGSLCKDGAMGSAYAVKENRMSACSVAVYCSLSSSLPEVKTR